MHENPKLYDAASQSVAGHGVNSNLYTEEQYQFKYFWYVNWYVGILFDLNGGK